MSRSSKARVAVEVPAGLAVKLRYRQQQRWGDTGSCSRGSRRFSGETNMVPRGLRLVDAIVAVEVPAGLAVKPVRPAAATMLSHPSVASRRFSGETVALTDATVRLEGVD